MAREILETRRKALRINLNAGIYGTFAEIGAGQEVARNFFTAGAASGTIAKTMSAYDMAFSDSIYGPEENGRYVSQSRLEKMLNHEYNLLTERLQGPKYAERSLFAFANTVTTLNFSKTNDPHGWIGIRFQHHPGSEPNEIIFHVRLLDSDALLQQAVLGVLGVNLVFGAYEYIDDEKTMIESLVDNIAIGSVEIDLIKVKGPAFESVNERLINLYLIAKGFSSAAIFDPEGYALQAKDFLYKKNIMILRTKYRQKSTPNFHLFNLAVEEFKRNCEINDDENIVVMIEVLMSNVLDEEVELSYEDLMYFASRAESLAATGNHVILSNFSRHNILAEFMAQFKPKNVGISTNISNLRYVFNSSNFQGNYTNKLLDYVSGMFSKNVKLYAYPYMNKKENKIITTENMPVSQEAKPLFDFLKLNSYIIDIDYDERFVKTL